MLFSGRMNKRDGEHRHPEDVAIVDTLHRVMAVIWFKPDGTILGANENFCKATGYQLHEIVGRHHRIFVDAAYAASQDYEKFWRILAGGSFHEGQYKRVRKDGSDLWIQASYNPVLDARGNVDRIIKFATDVTKRRTVIDGMLAAFRKQSEGDFSARIPPVATGEMGDFTRQFNESLDQKEKLFRDIAQLVSGMESASRCLSDHARDVAHQTASQSEDLARTLAAMNTVATRLKETTEKSRHSRRLARQADDKSGEGRQVVDEAKKVMARIKEGSSRMEKIVGVIDSIAFQTNLLSLNASVEAARAGDAGRGFAVVAQEVRMLAQDTARESSEIRELIRQSVSDIVQGVEVVERVGVVLGEIKTGIFEIVAEAEYMEAQSDAQIAGIRDASDALSTLEKSGRKSVQNSRDALQNSEDLMQRAGRLDNLVQSFGCAASRNNQPPPQARAAG
ncbi:MAG: PAS domain-containing methyl-accepting chemotaxis protein [Rhodobacteraceae bacterium]|nr:MAG: PAS domain-containing methyl-accepting chemotaxis protein [Paracoccaceae bacterium]